MNIQEHKESLEQEMALLKKELGEVAVVDRENPGGYVGKEPDYMEKDENPADPAEQGKEQEEFSKNQAITNDLETRLGHVQDALVAIEAGTYGVCTVCNKEIAEARMEANKSATTCIEHAE